MFNGGFGPVAGHGLRKPGFWAFALLHQLGRERLAAEGNGDAFGGFVHALAARREDGPIHILVANVTYDQTKARGSVELERRNELQVKGLESAFYRIRHLRVDSTHTNVFGA